MDLHYYNDKTHCEYKGWKDGIRKKFKISRCLKLYNSSKYPCRLNKLKERDYDLIRYADSNSSKSNAKEMVDKVETL